MTDYNTAEGESSVTDDCTDLPKRSVRALTEHMTVLADQGRVKGADDLYLVVSESGSEYLIDDREGVCDCPDFRKREPEGGCKHIRRVRYAIGAEAIPEWTEQAAIDPQLGEHTDGSLEIAVTDGGVSSGESDTAPLNADASQADPAYTYHQEPAHVGGARYVRCTECGSECVPAKPEQVLHYDGCSKADQ